MSESEWQHSLEQADNFAGSLAAESDPVLAAAGKQIEEIIGYLRTARHDLGNGSDRFETSGDRRKLAAVVRQSLVIEALRRAESAVESLSDVLREMGEAS